MTKIITWRKATDEEIEQGIDDPNNKGMILISIEVIEENNN